jgi:DNA-binding MarR family transcriptional regulator
MDQASICRVADQDPAAQELAVVLQDLAWLLPRTIGLAELQKDPMPTSELEVMRLLVRRPGLSVGEVAAELGLHGPNVSTAIRALAGRGLLERRPADEDRRIVRLHPTPQATAIRDRREEAWGAALAGVLDELPRRDAVALRRAAPALRRLADRLGAQAPSIE